MRRLLLSCCAVCCVFAFSLSVSADLRDAVPSDTYLATYHRVNPEREYMMAHYENVWATIEETQIISRFIDAVKEQMDQGDIDQAEEIWNTLSEAVEPIHWDAISKSTESIYAQRMAPPTAEHLFLIRLPEGEAATFVEGISNLFELADEQSNGEVTVETETFQGAELTWLQTPAPVPFSPCVGATEDVFIFASTRQLAQQSLELLGNPSADSKFDDERVAEALTHLPEVEDGITVFDGKLLFEQLDGYGDFIRAQAAGDADAQRVADLLEEVFAQFNAFDYEVTVEYTDGYQNRSSSYGKLSENAGETVMGQMVINQELFEDWSSWIPESATSYSLSSGATLHPLYDWAMKYIPENFPEAQDVLDQFAQAQQDLDLHLDQDLLQAFSGESVNVTIGAQSVSLMKCDNPERIHELLHRLVTELRAIRELASQNISLEEVEGMEGFEQVNATLLAQFGVRPIIGFHEGWMIIGSDADAIQTVLDTHAGNGPTIADSESFQKFNLPIDGPVAGLSYANTGESTRQMAQGLQQIGQTLPFFLAMAGAQGGQGAPDLRAAEDFLALLPDLGKIIGTLDFYEEQLSVTQPGEEELSYTRQSVTIIRPPAEE